MKVSVTTWNVVTGSGTGDLAGLSGTVVFEAGHRDEYSIELAYELATA